MADVYKGLTIRFGAETTGLDAALKDINKRSTDIGRELGQVNRLLKLDPRSTELLGQKQKLLADKIGATKQRLDALKQSQDKIAAMYKSGEIDEGAYRHFQRQIIDTELELKRLEAVGKKSAAEVGKAMQAAGKKMKAVGGDIKNAGRTATMGLTVPILAAGAAAVALGATFEMSMNQVQAATLAPAAEMGKLNALALQLGADTVFSAGEAAGAMLELAKAGITPAQIRAGALAAALTLAAAGGVSLESAATTTANALNMFGLEAAGASGVANAFAGGANASSASVDSLQQALAQVGPGARNAGLDLQDTVGVLASFADKGIQGSDAGTSLKTMLQRLVPQTDEAAKAMERYGLSFVDSKGNFKDITVIAEQLRTKLGGLTEAERAATLQQLFGSDATRAATVLMDEGAKGIEGYIKATRNQTAAQSMADARMKGTAGALENMRGSIESAAIVVSETLAPRIQQLAGFIKGLADSFSALSASSRESILVFAAIAAAIGPVLVIVGTLISSIGTIAGALGALVAAISAAGGIMAVLTGPIGIAVAIIAALAAVAYLVWANWSKLTPMFAALWAVIGPFFSWCAQTIRGALAPALESLRQAWAAIAVQLAPLLPVLKAVGIALGVLVVGQIVLVIGGIALLLVALAKLVQGVLWLAKAWAGALLGMRNAAMSQFAAIPGIASGAFNRVRDAAGGLANGVVAKFSQIRSSAASIFSRIGSAITGPINAAVGAVRSAIDRIRSFFNFRWSLPHLAMPHFSISGSFNPLKMQVPSVGVDWYAQGGVADRAMLYGVGERGKEAILPLSAASLQPFAAQIARLMPGGGVTNTFTGPFTFQTAEAVDRFADRFDMSGLAHELSLGR